MTACEQPIALLSDEDAQSLHTRPTLKRQRIGQGKFGSLFPHDAQGQTWTGCGAATTLRSLFSLFALLISAATQMSQREGKKKELVQLLV